MESEKRPFGDPGSVTLAMAYKRRSDAMPKSAYDQLKISSSSINGLRGLAGARTAVPWLYIRTRVQIEINLVNS